MNSRELRPRHDEWRTAPSRPHLLVLCAALVAATLSLSTGASAYHTEEQRQTDFSAYTLNKKEFRLGLFQQEYGIFEPWTVGTYTLPWIAIPVTQSFNASLYTKVKFLEIGPVAASARLNYFLLQVQNFSNGDITDADIRAQVLPMTLAASYRIADPVTATLEATWVQTFLNAQANSVDDTEAFGAGAQSNLQFALNGEWRVNRVIAVNLITRYTPLVIPALLRSNAQTEDGTTVDIEIEFDAGEVNHSWQVMPGVTFSWKTFNLQLGIGYGNVYVPGLKLVGADMMVLPDFDFYFRF